MVGDSGVLSPARVTGSPKSRPRHRLQWQREPGSSQACWWPEGQSREARQGAALRSRVPPGPPAAAAAPAPRPRELRLCGRERASLTRTPQPLVRVHISRRGGVGEEPGSLRPRAAGSRLHRTVATQAEWALGAPVSLLGETEEADLWKQPERLCRGLRAERSNFKGMGSPVPPSLSHRVRAHSSPGFCLTLHRPPG